MARQSTVAMFLNTEIKLNHSRQQIIIISVRDGSTWNIKVKCFKTIVKGDRPVIPVNLQMYKDSYLIHATSIYMDRDRLSYLHILVCYTCSNLYSHQMYNTMDLHHYHYLL